MCSVIVTGVHCPNCFAIPMAKGGKSWYCSKCFYCSPTAHLPTLKDYYLLLGKTINNKKFRTFFHVDSPYTASRMLKSLNLSSTGKLKSTQYELRF